MSAQKKGGWGSIFSGAVANLESRLDTILADDSEASARERAAEQAKAENLAVAPAGNSTPTPDAREASRSRVNDRLAERLARATQPKTSPRASVTVEDRDKVNAEVEQKLEEKAQAALATQAGDSVTDGAQEDTGSEALHPDTAITEPDTAPETAAAVAHTPAAAIRASIEVTRQSFDSPRPSTDIDGSAASARASLDIGNGEVTLPQDPSELRAEVENIRRESVEAEAQRHEEVQQYLERIDALQAKLTYLAKESVAAAKEANAAAGNSLERQIAEKDERIALLLQEGEKLSKDEMRHLQTIKKLRTKSSDDEKAAADLKRRLDRIERNEADLRSRLRKSEVAERQAKEKAKQIAIIDKQVDELKEDRENAAELIRSLTTQLKETKEAAAKAEKATAEKAADEARIKISSLQNDLEDAQIERKLAEDRSVADMKKIKEEFEHEKERFGLRELEYKNEIAVLESRLEATRARVEEASSQSATGVDGEANVKLLRQVETLQQQHALAKSNWETIEGSLTTRVATLEKERDEAHRRETDVRKKARDLGNKNRKAEEDLESAIDSKRSLEQQLQLQQEELTRIGAKLQQIEHREGDGKAEMDKQRQLWEAEFAQRLEEEKIKWRREAISSPRSETAPSFGRKASVQGLYLPSKRQTSRQISQNDIGGLYTTSPSGIRRGTNVAPRQATPTEAVPNLFRRESSISADTQDPAPTTPSIEVSEHPSEEFDNVSSPDRTINELFSNSGASAGVGPSVQLVERMSALVRKLEAEKASFRDELSRLSTQRDSARNEVVELMREVELKRSQDARVVALEKEVSDLNGRYEASLQVLGAREEEVAELKLDIADMKNIYRELVEAKVAT